MSLFKSQELWSVDLNIADAFDCKSLLIESISGRSCILVGSHDGYLRIYSPITDEPTFYKASDLLYETLFPWPVLQMEMACLVSGSNGRQLAILHPRSIAVYATQLVESENETVGSLRHAYQHNLQRPPFAFTTGSFGHVKGRHFICVQSLDGMLSFFEQESPTFETQLPDFLLPSPFCYLPETDLFIFQNADQYLVSYTYEELSQTKKTIKAHWSHNLGESIKDVQCVLLNEKEVILILTEKFFYTLNEDGKIVGVKVMDYTPLCFYNFENKATGTIISLICTETKILNIFEGTTLKWSTNLEIQPVGISRVNLGKLYGVVTLITDSGYVQCIYLGTVPSIYLIPPTAEPDIDIIAAEQQLKELHLKITDTDVNRNVEDILNVTLHVDKTVTVIGDKISCNVNVQLSAQTPVNNIQVLIIVEHPLVSTVENTIVPSVVNNEVVTAKIFAEGVGVISSLDVKTIVSFVMPNGAPRVVDKQEVLPLEVAMKLCAAEKDSLVKLTIATNKPTCPLNQLFPGDLGTANAIGLQFLNSESVVSIVAAKTSQRYRIQGENLENLSLVVDSLVMKLRSYHRRDKDLSFTFSGPLPVAPYFQQIQQHYSLVSQMRTLQEQLAQMANQYRTLQKKVLANLKDVQPKPTGALHKVLDETYEMIRKVAIELDQIEGHLADSRGKLAAHHRLFLTLLSIMSLSPQDISHLRVAFSPNVQDAIEQGWLEVHCATLSLLLRTELAKSSKDQNKPRPLSLEPIEDVTSLCKLITSVLDRATKGAFLMERAEFYSDKEALPTVPTVKEVQEKEVTVVPKAVKFMDLTGEIEKIKQPKILKDKLADEGKNENIVETHATIEHIPKEKEAEPGIDLPPSKPEEKQKQLLSTGSRTAQENTETEEEARPVKAMMMTNIEKAVEVGPLVEPLKNIRKGEKNEAEHKTKPAGENLKPAEDSIWDIEIDDIHL